MQAETQLQINCMRWFDLQFPQLRLLMHHSPNEGKTSKVTAEINKAMGVRAGFPDLIFLYPNHEGYHFLAIELKTHSRNSRQSQMQKEYESAIQAIGGKYVVVRDFYTFVDVVKKYIYRPLDMPPEHDPNPYRNSNSG